jgi:transglutaminase-like putative cysteine protease
LIRNPENLIYLKLKVEGIDLTNPHLNETRQRMDGSILEIMKEALPSKALPPLPLHHVPDDVEVFMAPDFNVESDDPQIRDVVRRILGDTSDPLSAAWKLLEWVYRNIEKKPVLSIPSALEVLKTRVGDCNEHAVLLTALLRAAGIPARLGIGLVYSRDKFYYHAWTEAWLGEWITMDPILNQMPADASHLKWVEGDLSRQVEIVRMVDALRIQVVDFRHD